MKKLLLLFLVFFFAGCRTAPTRQEVIDNAVNSKAASDALDESQKELKAAADDLKKATDDADDYLPDGPQKAALSSAVKRTSSALKEAEAAAELAKGALAGCQKVLGEEAAARTQAEKERDENAVDARRWRIAMWVLMIGGPLLLGLAVYSFIKRRFFL